MYHHVVDTGEHTWTLIFIDLQCVIPAISKFITNIHDTGDNLDNLLLMVQLMLKVQKREKFLVSNFEFFTLL
jgi:hypothetical protein